LVFHIEVNFSGFPFVAELGEDGADQAQERGFIWEATGHAGAPLEFLVHPFEWVTGAQTAVVVAWEDKGGEALR